MAQSKARGAEPSDPQVSQLHGARTAPAGGGGFFVLRGHAAPEMSGTVTVEGTYGGGWRLLATVPMRGGVYEARVELAQRRLLHLRVIYPDGSKSVGSVGVR
jgi:hypothetical protein